jgi:hypothetical protein
LRDIHATDSLSYKMYLDKSCIFWKSFLPTELSEIYVPWR